MHNEFEAKAAKEFEPIQAMTCKAAEQVARIAGVLAYMDEPNLKSMPSVLASSNMDPIVSSTAFMKQAEHWGLS